MRIHSCWGNEQVTLETLPCFQHLLGYIILKFSTWWMPHNLNYEADFKLHFLGFNTLWMLPLVVNWWPFFSLNYFYFVVYVQIFLAVGILVTSFPLRGPNGRHSLSDLIKLMKSTQPSDLKWINCVSRIFYMDHVYLHNFVPCCQLLIHLDKST